MKANQVTWFEIYVEDMARARRFYEAVLQIELRPLDSPIPGLEMWAFPGDQQGFGCSGALVRMEGAKPGGCGTLVYFHSEDCLREESRVVAAGGLIHRPRTAIGPYGFISLLLDTEGNLFGLHAMA